MTFKHHFIACWLSAVLVIFVLSVQPGYAQIPQGSWYCIQAVYNDTTVEGFEAVFSILSNEEYEAEFTLGNESGSAKALYHFDNDSLLITQMPQDVQLHGGGSYTSGGKPIYDYTLNCSQTTWEQAGQVALGAGFSTEVDESRILYKTVGDSVLILKSTDQKTILTYTFGMKRPEQNPVTFAVNMNVQQKLGNFNPGAGDRVILRNLLFAWVGNDSVLTESGKPGVYELSIDFPGYKVGNTMLYKFAIQKNSGGAIVESDPARFFTLEPGGQNLGIPYFNRQARPDEVVAFGVADSAVIGEYEPATAYNTDRDEFLVAWIQEPADIYGRIIKSDGTPAGPRFPISASNNVEIYPAVDYNSARKEWLVVWEDMRNYNSDIYGVRLDDRGKKLVSPQSEADSSFAISKNNKNQSRPKIAYNYENDTYLVVWTDYRNTRMIGESSEGNYDIYGQRINGDGALLTPGDPNDPTVNYAIAAQGNYNEYKCDVAYCGQAGQLLNEWLVVFSRSEVYYYMGGARIWGVRIKGGNGLLMNTWGEAIPQAPLRKGGSYGPPWLPEFPIGWDDQSFWGMLHFDQGSPHVESNDVPVPIELHKSAGSGYPIPEFLVAWTDMRADDNIYCQRIAYFPDSTAFRLGMKPTRGPDSLFTAVMLDKDGAWADTAAAWLTWPNIQVTTDPFVQSWNDLSYSSNDGAYMIVWNDWRAAAWNGENQEMNPFADIYCQRLWLNPRDSALVFIDHEGNLDVDPAFNTPIAFTDNMEGNFVYPAIAHSAQTNAFLVAYEFTEEVMTDIDIVVNLYIGASPNIPNSIDKSRSSSVPEQFVLQQNYPNPFNPTTTIAFELPAAAVVKVEVFNTLGRRVACLLQDNRPAGSYHVEWRGMDDNGLPVASGVYFYRVTAGNITAARKMVLMR
ncbi:MAG TPA: T9SS type A sorting domain-containing protein [bacterium]|nr:T9SS type A sorting domain-containing protein [bacterium]HPN44830.1 T9SS type A sorting domain-containing protein [bacterium]